MYLSTTHTHTWMRTYAIRALRRVYACNLYTQHSIHCTCVRAQKYTIIIIIYFCMLKIILETRVQRCRAFRTSVHMAIYVHAFLENYVQKTASLWNNEKKKEEEECRKCTREIRHVPI